MGFTSLPIKWAGKAANPLYHSFRQKDTGNDAASQGLSLWEQRRRPPPVAETGSRCWGRGQQDASKALRLLGAATRAVALRSNDGEGKPGTKEPLRSDGQALCQSDAIAVPELFGSVLALSVSLRSPALPKGEPLPERATVNLWKMHE